MDLNPGLGSLADPDRCLHIEPYIVTVSRDLADQGGAVSTPLELPQRNRQMGMARRARPPALVPLRLPTPCRDIFRWTPAEHLLSNPMPVWHPIPYSCNAPAACEFGTAGFGTGLGLRSPR